MKLKIGTLEYLSDKLFGQVKKKHKKSKPLQTVELKVRMDCEGCERKVKKVLDSMKGVNSVEVDRKLQKVTVNGYIDPSKVLKKVKGTGKKTELWPYEHYDALTAPEITPQTYDKKAPAGYVRKVSIGRVPSGNRPEEIFSEENPNACTVM